jgi:RimJ/RimL family protein N-acetyltransferase
MRRRELQNGYARRAALSVMLRESVPVSTSGPSSQSGFGDQTLRLSFPEQGLAFDDLVLRLPNAEDLQELAAAFAAGELSEADNISPFRPDDLRIERPGFVANRELARLVVADVRSGATFGGGTLHHLDTERGIIEIGYWLYPRARGRGIATKVARALAEYAFTIGVQRVTAYVSVGNRESERVLERAGFTREGILRSMPTSDGGRVDKTIFSLLPGE